MNYFPHAHLVPRGLGANLQWRKYVLDIAYESEENREELWNMCSEDPLFFALTFCWLLEPRLLKHNRIDGRLMPNTIPFLFWDMQEEVFCAMVDNALGEEPSDMAIVKSRAVGASWLMLALFLWFWIFWPDGAHFGLVSATEEKVDSASDPDALLNKFQFFLDKLPYFLQPRYTRNRSEHVFLNQDTGSTVSGYAATGDVMRGGRKLMMGGDEFHSFKPGDDSHAMDSTQHVTNIRIWISTPNRKRGPSGAFYDIVDGAEQGANNTKLIKMEWWKVPFQRRGLYRWPKDGKLELLDPGYDYTGYEFIEGGPFDLKSPWFDRECKRGGSTVQKILAELCLEFGSLGADFFDHETRTIAASTITDPLWTGTIRFDPETYDLSWHPSHNGDFQVWAQPEPNHKYTMGIDVSAGTGGSRSNYSAISIWDRTTRSEVLLFKSNTIKPDQLADLAHALGLAYNTAQVAPETNGGSGQTCLNRLVDSNYPNMYYRRMAEKGYAKYTDKPGYRNQDKGELILTSLVAGIWRREATLKSATVLRELGQYIYKNGKLEHSSTLADEDEANKGTSHGDCAIASALGWYLCSELPKHAKPEEKKQQLPEYSIGARRASHARAQANTMRSWGL